MLSLVSFSVGPTHVVLGGPTQSLVSVVEPTHVVLGEF